MGHFFEYRPKWNTSFFSALVSQPRLYGTPFPKNYMTAQSLSYVLRVCWRNICFVPSLMVAERRALLSLHLHFVAQYQFFFIIIIISNVCIIIIKLLIWPSDLQGNSHVQSFLLVNWTIATCLWCCHMTLSNSIKRYISNKWTLLSV